MARNLEVTQQWQFLGKVQPELLKDEILEACKKVGITSLQSYLYWAEVEKESGRFDFSSYDILVEKLKKHNLKWVPFLILGPNYATPRWFQESKESVYAKCLSHQKESKIQSIWNPNLPKYVDRFLKKVAEHYREKGIFESIALGISGNWGEAIYPADGGFYKNFHTHLGWWCADKYARDDFINFVLQRYGTLEKVNTLWETNFQESIEIGFPTLKAKERTGFINCLFNIFSKSPLWLKVWLKAIVNHLLRLIGKRKAFIVQETSSRPKRVETFGQRKHWLDFIDWYLGSMTRWAEFWIKTARKYFPNTKIYLVTGGAGHPAFGADFSNQTKMAAKYNAGIRITNQTNEYAQSFILTRLVSSAARFYGSYFTTEEAAVLQTPEGVTMRVFDALSSGARGLYCKNIINIGGDPCIKKNLPVGKITKGAENLAKNLCHFISERPIIKIAVFFPNTSIAFDPSLITSLYNKSSLLRDILDLDLIDENMIKDGGIERYQLFLILEGEIPDGEIAKKIKNWTERGGILISAKDKKNYLEFIKETILNQKRFDPWFLSIDGEIDGVYATRFSDKIIYYNSNNFKIRKKVGLNSSQRFIEIEGNSILSIPLKT